MLSVFFNNIGNSVNSGHSGLCKLVDIDHTSFPAHDAPRGIVGMDRASQGAPQLLRIGFWPIVVLFQPNQLPNYRRDNAR